MQRSQVPSGVELYVRLSSRSFIESRISGLLRYCVILEVVVVERVLGDVDEVGQYASLRCTAAHVQTANVLPLAAIEALHVVDGVSPWLNGTNNAD